jgi:hypothetical protein
MTTFLCYVDEAGCLGRLPGPVSDIQPVFVIAGAAFKQERLHTVTTDFLSLKSRFFPGLLAPAAPHLNAILTEIKGADVRRDVASSSRHRWRQAIGFLDHFLRLMETHNSRVFGRVWIKGIGLPFDPTAVCTSSMHTLKASMFARDTQNSNPGLEPAS